jgi:tetratricopeptide (TPR) repeat protein/predicted Ser/Thr protein kinase
VAEDDADAAAIRAARVEQRDAVAEVLRANVRRKLVGVEAAPVRIGRFTVLEPIGRGAMGTVFAAYDPVLDRKVALKLLHAAGERAREELLREARALARLTHPHVVAVHEADAHEDRVWIAMEFVPGPDLHAWLAEATRPPAEILAVFASAGTGLAAAHDAGVAHGDFKPHNVIVGPRGAKVADFGMAQVGDRDDASHGGTPRYLAPERLDGGPPSAAADQFAFAVALWEALAGADPFRGEGSRREAMREAPTIPRVRGVPARVWLLLRRALDPDPAARHPAMHDLVARLQPGVAARRRMLAGLGLGGIAILAALAARGSSTPDPCAAGQDEALRQWDEAASARVRAAFEGTHAPFADEVADRVDARLKDRAQAWAAAHRDNCEATRVRGVQSDSRFDLRTRCLEREAAASRALVEALEATRSAADVAEAIAAVDALPSIDRCGASNVRAEEHAEPGDPATAERVAAARRTIDRGWAAYRLARYAEATALAESAARAAQAEAWAPLSAEAGLLVGVTQARTGRPRDAEAALRRAALEAASVQRHRLGAEISRELLRTIMFVGDAARVEDLADFARADALRAGLDPTEIDGILGEARLHAGDAAGAIEPLQRAFAAETSASRRAIVRSTLASAELQLGRASEALEGYREAHAIAEAHFGPGHPALGFHLHRIGRGLSAVGELVEAESTLRAALAQREAVLGPDDRAVASTLVDLADVERARGRLPEARADLERAARIRAAAYGESHASLAEIELLRGEVELAADDLEAARSHFSRALELREAQTPDHPEVETLRARLRELGAR